MDARQMIGMMSAKGMPMHQLTGSKTACKVITVYRAEVYLVVHVLKSSGHAGKTLRQSTI
jgi:hypothetical protein